MALRRLTLRRQNKEAERKYKNEEKERRLLTESDVESEGESTPTCMTPGSVWSGGESYGGYLGSSAHNFKAFMPEKLQIVKPMEGKTWRTSYSAYILLREYVTCSNKPGTSRMGLF